MFSTPQGNNNNQNLNDNENCYQQRSKRPLEKQVFFWI